MHVIQNLDLITGQRTVKKQQFIHHDRSVECIHGSKESSNSNLTTSNRLRTGKHSRVSSDVDTIMVHSDPLSISWTHEVQHQMEPPCWFRSNNNERPSGDDNSVAEICDMIDMLNVNVSDQGQSRKY